MKLTNNLKRIATAYPKLQALIDAISIANGFTAKEVAEHQREIRLAIFQSLMSKRRPKIWDGYKIMDIPWSDTTKGGDYWIELERKCRKLIPNYGGIL